MPEQRRFLVELDAADKAVGIERGRDGDARAGELILRVARPERRRDAALLVEPVGLAVRTGDTEPQGAHAGSGAADVRVGPRPQGEHALIFRVAAEAGHRIHAEERHIAGPDAVLAMDDGSVQLALFVLAVLDAEAAILDRLIHRSDVAFAVARRLG